MMGLIRKDFYMVKKSILYVLAVMLFFGVIYSSSGNYYFISGMASIMVVSVIGSTMSYDEFYHWDRYAATLPVPRGKIVGAKYLFTLLLTAGAAVISIGAGALFSAFHGDPLFPQELWATVGASLLVGLMGTAVILPCYYRFGAQRCRFLIVAVYGVPALVVAVVWRLLPVPPTAAQLEAFLTAAAAASPFLCLAILGVSFLISVRIFTRKELK